MHSKDLLFTSLSPSFNWKLQKSMENNFSKFHSLSSPSLSLSLPLPLLSLSQSLQIADVVASDNHCLYNEFTSEELKHFLHLMHTSALEQVQIVDQDSFGYPLTS